MKTEKDTTASEKVDKRNALLALAINAKDSVIPCLTTEEMAHLVEHGFSPDTKNVFQEHLDSCEQCYQEWLALTALNKKSSITQKNKVYHLFQTPKVLTYIGSGLAVAASILLFINIDFDLRKQGKSLPEAIITEEAEIRTESAPAVPVIDEESPSVNSYSLPQEESVKRAAPPIGKMEKKERRDRESTTEKAQKTMAKPQDKALKSIAPKASSPAPAAPATQAPASISRSRHAPPPQNSYMDEVAAPRQRESLEEKSMSGASFEISYDLWILDLKKECTSQRFDQIFWKQSKQRGSLLNQNLREEGSVSRSKLILISTLLNITSSVTADNMTGECKKIRRLLEEDVRNR